MGNEELLGYTEQEYRKFKKFAIRYLLLFSVMCMTLYCCRLNLTYAAPVMMDELGWTKADIGVLTSALFWTYAFSQIITGRLADKVGGHILINMCAVFTVVANVVLGFQSSRTAIIIVWTLNGLFQSWVSVPAITTVSAWFPGNRRGFALGFTNAFTGFGQVCAALAVALSFALFPDMGWRAAFIFPPLVPIVFFAIFRLFSAKSPESIGLRPYKEPCSETAETEERLKELINSKGKLYPYRYILSDRRFIFWIVIAFITGLARYGLVTWIPLYFVERFGVDVTQGLFQSLALPVGMGFGTLIVPALTDRLCPENRLNAVIIPSLVAALTIVCFAFLSPLVTIQRILIVIMLFIAGFCIFAINGTAWAYAADLGGRVLSGTGSGILNFFSYLGAASQSLVFGFLSDSIGWITVFVSIAVMCAAIAVLGVLSEKAAGKK